MVWDKESKEKFKKDNPEYQQNYYVTNREKKIKYQREYENTNREERKKYYELRWRNTRKLQNRKILNKLKINGCAICGYDKCVASLDFHHVNPRDKQYKISIGFMSYTNENISDEVNKCILLCKNCHYEIHNKERKNRVKEIEGEMKKNE